MTTHYGRDVSCTDRLRTGRLVSGMRLLAEAVYRRITTPRGSLYGRSEDVKNYGIDITELVGSAVTPASRAAAQDSLAAEIGKDERIERVVVTIVESVYSNGAVTWDTHIACEAAEGPFALQVRATALTAELLGVG